MENQPENARFTLRLLIDEKRSKVVLAEICRDFVDVLFSLLTLPIGTIVRLLEQHCKPQQTVTVGCFNNLYRSVSEMSVDEFETEACKNMLVYPRSTKEIHCRKLKMNIDDTEATKFVTCPNFSRLCTNYTNFNTSRCSYCGNQMTRQCLVSENEQLGEPIGDGDGVFVTCRSSYILTDDFKVELCSLGVISNVLNGLGYQDFDDLHEIHLDVGFEEVLNLLGNLLVSEFPLTSTFLGKPFIAKFNRGVFTHLVKTEHVIGAHECSVKLFVRKSDSKILYAECSEDFIDNLLTFLVLPLELAWLLSNDTTILSCVKNLILSECRDALASKPWEFPYYYTFSNQLLGVPSQPLVDYKCLFTSFKPLHFSRNTNCSNSINVTPMDPKAKPGIPSMFEHGFVKRDTKFIVSDDLVVTPMSSSSTIGLFRKSKVNISDLEEQVINISKAELVSILKASLTSCSALTNGLSYKLAKKPKKLVGNIFEAEISLTFFSLLIKFV